MNKDRNALLNRVCNLRSRPIAIRWANDYMVHRFPKESFM